MFDNPEVRFAVLDMLVNQRLLANKARDEVPRHRRAAPAVHRGILAFQADGKFSVDQYNMWLSRRT